jgi:hypothetical protein
MKNDPYAGLSNEELIVIYKKFKDFSNEVNKNLSNNVLHQKVNTPIGEAVRVITLTDEDVEKYKASELYKHSESIVNKLKVIVELISSTDLPESQKAKAV